MKKNLQFVLALTLGLATTVSAQDWSVDSRTRVNSTEDAMSTDQRVRTSVDFGGEAVSAHVELNSAATLGAVADEDFSLTVREAYATTNVMSYASLTAGRMALNFGSGRILGDNNWVAGNGNTWDGFLVGLNTVDFADIHLGYASTDSTDAGTNLYDGTTMYLNAAKDMGAMSFNFLYVNTQNEGAFTARDDVYEERISMGFDGTYAMDNGANLSLGYYTSEQDGLEMDLTTLGVSYGVNEALTVKAGYDMYGKNGFYLATGSFGNRYGSGMNYESFAGFEGTDVSFGGSYAMGDFMLGATMHNVTSEDDADEYSVTDISLGYTLSDNSSINVNYSTSDENADVEFTKTWIALNIAF
jgi:hypothetical protein